MSALTYSLVLGKLKCFQYLLDELGASLAVMHDQLSYLRKKPVDVLLEDCNFVFLDYYLPIHIRYGYSSPSTLATNSLIEDLSFLNPGKPKIRTKLLVTSQPSVHRVVERGNIKALQYLLDYFQDSSTPCEFDANHVDEASGENCALVAVRSGSLEMVRFLYETYKADFHILNKRRESALQVAAAASKKNPKEAYLAIISFLVEEVKVDLLYNCEETLMLCEDQAIITYLEAKFTALGTALRKSQLEEPLPNSQLMFHHVDSDQVAKMRYFEQASVSELIREEHNKRNSLSTIRRESQDSTFSQDILF
jgi:hypothetical protein